MDSHGGFTELTLIPVQTTGPSCKRHIDNKRPEIGSDVVSKDLQSPVENVT